MKILMLFIDAMRVDKLSILNDKLTQDTVLDKYIKDIGGEIFTNCFTSSPDTYRSLASLFTGLNSWESNCDTYSKPLNPFGTNHNTIWDQAVNNKFSIDIFHLPLEKYIFPQSIQNNISDEINLKKFKSQLKLQNDHIVWIGLNDFRHHCCYGKYNSRKIHENLNKLKQPLDIIDQDFIKKFDHIFIFSDHGVLFDKELLGIYQNKKFQILDTRRTQLLLIHKQTQNNHLDYNDNLCYLSDMNPILNNLINKIENKKIKQDREYLIVEDMDFASMDLSSKPSLFSLVTKDEIYIRSFLQQIGTSHSGPNEDMAYLLNRKSLTGKLINSIHNKDQILFSNYNFAYIYKIYNFWMNQKIINQNLRQKLGLFDNAVPDSMGNPITYSTQFSLISTLKFLKQITPPVIFNLIKYYYKKMKNIDA